MVAIAAGPGVTMPRNCRTPACQRAKLTRAACLGLVALTVAAVIGAAQAQERRATRFWNLTGETIMHLSMAPTGTADWGPDQCRNDPDGSVDFDERLRITDVATGRYDVRLTGKTGQSCVVTGVEVKAGAVFAIDKDALAHCHGR
jgi:hypothetical protein